MRQTDKHRQKLRHKEWERLLLSESGPPGPRANLELLQVGVEARSNEQFLKLLHWMPNRAPSATREEFLAARGAAGRLPTRRKRGYVRIEERNDEREVDARG